VFLGKRPLFSHGRRVRRRRVRHFRVERRISARVWRISARMWRISARMWRVSAATVRRSRAERHVLAMRVRLSCAKRHVSAARMRLSRPERHVLPAEMRLSPPRRYVLATRVRRSLRRGCVLRRADGVLLAWPSIVYVWPTMLVDLKKFLELHLLTLSGSVVTPASILIALAQ
jgi:hypothetical protein